MLLYAELFTHISQVIIGKFPCHYQTEESQGHHVLISTFHIWPWPLWCLLLSGIAFAMGQPVKWSTMTKMFVLPSWNVGRSTTKSMETLAKGLRGISVVCNWYLSAWSFSLLHNEQLSTWACMLLIILGQ